MREYDNDYERIRNLYANLIEGEAVKVLLADFYSTARDGRRLGLAAGVRGEGVKSSRDEVGGAGWRLFPGP